MELTKLSAVEMASFVRERKISPVELVEAHLAQVDRLNPTLNAFVHLCAEDALGQAKAAESEATRESTRPLL